MGSLLAFLSSIRQYQLRFDQLRFEESQKVSGRFLAWGLCKKLPDTSFGDRCRPKAVPDTFLHSYRAKKMSGTFWSANDFSLSI